MTLLCALALLLPFGGPPSDAELLLESPGGHFHARLAKVAGQEKVADAIARWKLTVSDVDGRALWSCFHPAPHTTPSCSASLPLWSCSEPIP